MYIMCWDVSEGLVTQDAVLITETGAEVLTESCTRKSDEIEFIMSQ